MRRVLVAVSIAALLAAAFSFAASRWLARRSQQQNVTVSIHDAAWLKRDLGLTEAQAAEIGKIEKEFGAKLESCCEAHCTARFALSEELAKPEVDLSKASACVDRMCAAQVESEHATLRHILRVRAVLTPEQRKRYAELISQQICTACPLGLHTKAQ